MRTGTPSFLCSIILITLGLGTGACRAWIDRAAALSPGDSPERVRSRMGEPARTGSFLLPEVPFFGPQESLTGLVPAGTPVEEWVYVQGDEELYVWFRCDQGEGEADCGFIYSARYPLGAVY